MTGPTYPPSTPRLAPAIVVIAACGSAPPPPPRPEPAPAPPTAVVEISPRRCEALGVDWCNRTYGTELEFAPIELIDGDWEVHIYACDNGEHTTQWFRLHQVVTGDLDHDGLEDAVVAIDEHYYGCGDQGSYQTTHLIAYRLAAGVPTAIGKTQVDAFRDWELTVVGDEVRRIHQGGCTEQWRLDHDALAAFGTTCVAR